LWKITKKTKNISFEKRNSKCEKKRKKRRDLIGVLNLKDRAT
jgi:hypothetical protein